MCVYAHSLQPQIQRSGACTAKAIISVADYKIDAKFASYIFRGGARSEPAGHLCYASRRIDTHRTAICKWKCVFCTHMYRRGVGRLPLGASESANIDIIINGRRAATSPDLFTGENFRWEMQRARHSVAHVLPSQ
jgi:hypothetical protein